MSGEQSGDEPRTDWVGKWFKLWEEDGECMAMRIGLLRPGRSEPEWSFLDHSKSDGVGAFASFMRQQGVELPLLSRRDPNLPDELAPEGSWTTPHALASSALWKDQDPTWRPVSVERSRPEAIGWFVASREQTEEIAARAGAAHSSVPSYCWAALNETLRSRLKPDSGPSVWWLTVNMRGTVEPPTPTANCFCMIDVEVPPGTGPRELDGRLRALLSNGAHLRAWQDWNIGSRIGFEGMRVAFQRRISAGVKRVGIFSPLQFPDYASFPPEHRPRGAELLNQLSVVAFPPPSRLVPMGVNCGVAFGRLMLAMQIHRSVSTDRAYTQAIVDEWRARLLDPSSQPSPPTPESQP